MNLRDLPATATGGWPAELHLEFARRGERTLLAGVRHRGPLRVQRPFYPEGGGVCQALLLHPPAGIAGGDRLHIRVDVAAGAHAQLTTPGAGKWYRSGGAVAEQSVVLNAAAGAVLEWLPQESIVFDGALARTATRVDLAADAAFVGWDILCLGRSAAGERFRRGHLSLALAVHRAGRPCWLERGEIAGNDPLLASPAGWAGHAVSGTLIATAPGLAQQAAGLVARCRERAPADGARHGLSALPELIVARYLGDSSEAARHWLSGIWRILRPACCGREAVIPRIWNT